MKKLLLFVATMVALCAAPRLAKAQNIQMHYDFGRHIYSKDTPARPRLTTTVEMFAPTSGVIPSSSSIWITVGVAYAVLIGRLLVNLSSGKPPLLSTLSTMAG